MTTLPRSSIFQINATKSGRNKNVVFLLCGGKSAGIVIVEISGRTMRDD